jgi:hypothetical protein
MTPCSPLRVNRRFGLLGLFFEPEDGGDMFLRKVGWNSMDYTASYRRRWYSSACHLLACWFLLNLFLRPWIWRRYVPPKRRLNLNGLHGVISQKMILFCLPPACLVVFAKLISSTLKMEAICSSEASIETQRTTRHHIPEDGTFHNHRCENLNSYIVIIHFISKQKTCVWMRNVFDFWKIICHSEVGSDLYQGGSGYSTRPADRISWLISVVVFLSTSKDLKLRHDRFLPRPL